MKARYSFWVGTSQQFTTNTLNFVGSSPLVSSEQQAIKWFKHLSPGMPRAFWDQTYYKREGDKARRKLCNHHSY
jgi:hypothetical protein